MINKIIRASLQNRALVLLLAAMLTAWASTQSAHAGRCAARISRTCR